MKRIIATILSLLLVFSSLTTVFAESEPFTISGQSVSAKAGETVSVKFSIQNNPGISICSLELVYDPTVLELQEINGNPLLDGNFFGNVAQNFVLWANYSGDTNYNGVMFTAVFSVKEGARFGLTDVSVRLPDESDSILNNKYESLLPNLVSGGVFIDGTSLFGDVNRDNNVDAADVVCIASMILGKTETSSIADLNSDGFVNVIDMVVLKKNLANR